MGRKGLERQKEELTRKKNITERVTWKSRVKRRRKRKRNKYERER